LAHGLADDQLSCQALAFPGPLVIAPAMNPRLWNAPATRANCDLLRSAARSSPGPPAAKWPAARRAGGASHPGGNLRPGPARVTKQDLAGIDVLLTLGPTREYFDCVRYWSNPSTGTMGAALAVAAWLRGARVRCRVRAGRPVAAARHRACGRDLGLEMHQAAMDSLSRRALGLLHRRRGRFPPEPFGPGKFKKESGGLAVAFAPNPDILAAMGRARTQGPRLCGFAAEAADAQAMEAQARGKLQRKNLDLIIANDVTAPGCGFAAPTNGVLALDAQGRTERWPVLPKTEVAWRIWDWMLALAS
jgi:phosphopantothenoylcysteine decarboxylase/phosphopantothenate--cysteine ligase